jgi:hypothetical protein
MLEIGRRELLLLLVGLTESGMTDGKINGITRLQKYLFLLEREGGLTELPGGGFGFEPYKAGPYSSKLYDDLELLENLGLVASAGTAEASDSESADIDRLSFDDLMGSDVGEGVSRTPDSFEERCFTLTPEGIKWVESLKERSDIDTVLVSIKRVKSSFSHYSLRDLLRYVYKRYPEMTTESEIIDEVMGRRRN